MVLGRNFKTRRQVQTKRSFVHLAHFLTLHLKPPQHSPLRLATKMIDWNTYFSSLRKYLDYYRQRDQMPAMRGFSTLSLPMTTSATVAGAGQVLMSEQELAGLVSLTQLITSIVVKVREHGAPISLRLLVIGHRSTLRTRRHVV